jgi:hypothetical protein
MLKVESRFLKDVIPGDMQKFLTEMRELKRLIFSTAVDSVQEMWKDYVPNQTEKKPRKSKKKKGAAATDEAVAPVGAEQTYAAVKGKLDALRSEFLQPLDTVFKRENIDSVCNVVELKQLQGLIPRGLTWTTHENKPSAAENNLLSFCLSGYRLRLIKELSSQVFASEATKFETESKPATKGKDHGDGTADYQDAKFEPMVRDEDEDDETAKFFKVTYVPIQKPGSRFVCFTKDAAFNLLMLPEGVLDEWKKGHPAGDDETHKDSKIRNRESEWCRLFFRPGPINRMARKNFYITSFSSDGAPIFFSFLFKANPSFLTLEGVAVHFSFVSADSKDILNARYELQSESARKGERHTTWEPRSVSPASKYGICKLDQLILWKDGGITLAKDGGGKPMRVRIIGIDPNRVNNLSLSLSLFPLVLDFDSFKLLQSGTAAVAYVFESEEEVLEMSKPEKKGHVKQFLEREENFMWLANEMVSFPSFHKIHFIFFILHLFGTCPIFLILGCLRDKYERDSGSFSERVSRFIHSLFPFYFQKLISHIDSYREETTKGQKIYTIVRDAFGVSSALM